MRRVESWQRPLALLLAGSLFVVYGPLYGQVGVRLIQPVKTSVEASTAALQQARSSLLEARLAVDDALYEVERALGLLAGDAHASPEPAPPADESSSASVLGSLQSRIQARVAQTSAELRALFADLPAALTHLNARLGELSEPRAVVSGSDCKQPQAPEPSNAADGDEPAQPEWVSTPAPHAAPDEGVALTVEGAPRLVPAIVPSAYEKILDPVVLPTPPETEELPATPTDAELPPFDATVIRPEGLRLKRR